MDESIYQAEIYIGGGNTLGATSSFVRYDYLHGITGIKEVRSFSASLVKNGISYPMPYYQDGNVVTYVQSITAGGAMYVYNKVAWPDYYWHILVTYTKN